MVSRLRTEAAALNAPVPAADLAKVEALLKQGDYDTAALLSEAFLARSEAQAQVPFRRGSGQPLHKAHGASPKGAVANCARMLRGRHWKVAVSEDGTEFETKPPHAGGLS